MPDTLSWEEYMDLQKKIAEKIPPWTYQGKYPGYFWDCVQRPLQYKKAGPKAFCDIDNLVEGAFLDPDILWGIEQIQAFFKNDWIYPGSEAMTHTESPADLCGRQGGHGAPAAPGWRTSRRRPPPRTFV